MFLPVAMVLSFQPALISASIFRRTSASTSDPSGIGQFFFDQLLDHTNPSSGTFKQRYFFSDKYYVGQGSPVIISSPGEQSADGFDIELSGPTLQNAMMQIFGAAGVILEHRYWGQSSPYSNLTTRNLQYLQVSQAIDDYKYFVENVQLSWKGLNSKPSVTPWVNLGCSYPGLLVAYTQQQYSDLFAAAWASSAPVQAEGDFWQYFSPIEEGMPKNCSADASAVVAFVDLTLASGSPANVSALKAQFGLEALANDDFASALTLPLHAWQNQQPSDFEIRGEDVFYRWCDALECSGPSQCNSAATGVGLAALQRWATWFKAYYVDPACPGIGGACFSTYMYDSPAYTDTSIANPANRAWMWLTCTELGYFQDGDPGNMTSIVSSWITPASNARRCNNMFLTANGTSGNYAPSDTVSNVKYKGWDVVSPNTFFVNGEFDPWRSASLSSSWGPSRLQVEKQNITVIPGARHCWDQSMLNAQLNVDVLNVQTRGLMQVRGWLEVWYGVHADMNITNMMPAIAAQVGLPGGKPLTELIDMGTLSSGKSPVAGGGLGSSLTNNELATKGCTTLELVSLVANVVFLLIILVLIFGLLRERRARTHGSRMYTMDASFVPTIRYKNQIRAEDVLGGYVASRVINGGRGTYQKVENT